MVLIKTMIINKSDVSDQIKSIVTKTTNNELITEESDLHYDLDLDSLEKLEIIVECEREYGIEIHEVEIDSLETVGKLIELIWYKLNVRCN